MPILRVRIVTLPCEIKGSIYCNRDINFCAASDFCVQRTHVSTRRTFQESSTGISRVTSTLLGGEYFENINYLLILIISVIASLLFEQKSRNHGGSSRHKITRLRKNFLLFSNLKLKNLITKI